MTINLSIPETAKPEAEKTALEENATMESLTENEILPEPNEDAINANKQAAQSTLKNDDNVSPEIYEKNPDGSLKKNKDGTPRKKRGRKKESVLNAPQNSNPADFTKYDSKQTAVVISGVIEKTGVAIMGDDYIYQEIERESNVKAWEKTINHYGGLNLSPPAALAIDHLSIILARANKPSTKKKVAGLLTWFSLKYERVKNALSRNRQNNERKNDIRQEESESTSSDGNENNSARPVS